MSVSVESSTVLVFSGVKVITVLDVIASEFDAVMRDLSVCPCGEIVVVVNDFDAIEGVRGRCRGHWRTAAQG